MQPWPSNGLGSPQEAGLGKKVSLKSKKGKTSKTTSQFFSFFGFLKSTFSLDQASVNLDHFQPHVLSLSLHPIDDWSPALS